MPSIKKSELDKLRTDLHDVTVSRDHWRNQWVEKQELLSEAEARLTERNQTVAKLLHNGINLAAELRKEREEKVVLAKWNQETIFGLLWDNTELGIELALQKEIPKMVEQVVHYVNEWNPGTFYSTHEPDPIPANPPVPPEIKPKRNYARLAVGLLIGALIGALIGMTALLLREAYIISEQRGLITEMYNYLITNCPLPQ